MTGVADIIDTWIKFIKAGDSRKYAKKHPISEEMLVPMNQEAAGDNLLFIGGSADGERMFVSSGVETIVVPSRPELPPIRAYEAADYNFKFKSDHYRRVHVNCDTYVMVESSIAGTSIATLLLAGYQQPETRDGYPRQRGGDSMEQIVAKERADQAHKDRDRLQAECAELKAQLTMARGALREAKKQMDRHSDCTVHRPFHDGPQRRIVMAEAE